MGTRQRFAIPDGWVARGFRFEVEPTSAEQPGRIAQSFGSRRFAYNWALAQVKANLDARTTDPAVPLLAWNFYELRRAWNQAKDAVAPWWRCSSKEAYASGIADLVVALHNWSDAKAGRRAGGRVGFPRFKARHRDHGRVRFTTGAMRLEPDRRYLVLPVIGRLRSKENTRRLQRLAAKDRARVLSMTLSEQGGRLFVAVQAIVCQQPQTPSQPQTRCGIDLGVGNEWAVVAHHDDTIERIAHPTPWVETHTQRRRVARQRSRRIVGSRGRRQANAKLAALDRRAANLRTQSIHTLTTRLSSRYGTVIIEDLDVAAMGRGMGRRAFRRTVAQAGIGRVRPPWPTRPRGRAASWLLPTAGLPRRRLITAAVATWPTSRSASEYGCALGAGRPWTAMRTRPATSVTGPDRSPPTATVTGMSSGVELPPRCRSWATTAGRPTLRVVRARLHNTILGWREPLTSEPTPAPEARGGTPSRGISQRALTNAH
jgi:transposase